MKKPSRKKPVNIVDDHTQKRTPVPRAAKAAGMKTPILKPIQPQQPTSSKRKKLKQTARVIFPPIQSKSQSPEDEEAVSNLDSPINKETFISKNVFDSFRDEVRQKFKAILTLVRKKYKLMLKSIEQSKQIDVYFYYLRKKSKYDPNRSYKFSTVDCNFMNIIRFVHDVYSMDDPNLTTGGQEAHFNEYISGLRMHATVSWHTVEDIYIPVNIKEKHHWVLAVLFFSKRCIFLYDSYESSGHYPIIFAQIKKLAEIIPLCLQTCDFYNNKRIDLQNHPRYKDKDYSNLFDVIFEENLSQQPSRSLDCGVFMVTYAECLSYGHKVFATEFDPNTLRRRYASLLWDYGIRK
ncbi:hypothetical protein FXO38_25221 [Capsicum annuum]|nr:hypothetical protein FXO38_25221 [Capsicum annuum]